MWPQTCSHSLTDRPNFLKLGCMVYLQSGALSSRAWMGARSGVLSSRAWMGARVGVLSSRAWMGARVGIGP